MIKKIVLIGMLLVSGNYASEAIGIDKASLEATYAYLNTYIKILKIARTIDSRDWNAIVHGAPYKISFVIARMKLNLANDGSSLWKAND